MLASEAARRRLAPAARGGLYSALVRRVLTLLAVAAAAGLAALLVARAWREPPTDEALVRALFVAAASAAQDRQVSEVVAGVSARFAGGGLDREGARRLVAFHVLRGEWVSVTISGAEIAVEGDRARANVDAVLARGGAKGKPLAALLPGEASAHRFAFRLEREAEGWRVVGAEWRPVDSRRRSPARLRRPVRRRARDLPGRRAYALSAAPSRSRSQSSGKAIPSPAAILGTREVEVMPGRVLTSRM